MHLQSSPPVTGLAAKKLKFALAASRIIWSVCLTAVMMVLACTFGHSTDLETTDSLYRFRESLLPTLEPEEAGQLVHNLLDEAGPAEHLPELDILTPYHGAVFPKDMASPEITWEDTRGQIWLVCVSFATHEGVVCMLTDQMSWTPDRKSWEKIKSRAIENPTRITVYGVSMGKTPHIVSRNFVSIGVSTDPVSAPLFFQHIPLPFAYAARHPELSQWRLGDIAAYAPPPVVMENLPVCGNCHGFSPDAKLFGMDMDINGDKGAYLLTDFDDALKISPENFITWNDFPGSEHNANLGLFSQISPDRNTVLSTVRETSFFTMIPDIDYSQLFFPIKGVIACYSRKDNRFFALPGADLSDHVQTCPAWHPDGRTIVFARAKHDPRLIEVIGDKGYLTIAPDVRIEDLNRQYQIRYDLYTVPFNNGQGGNAVPLAGASANGKSNYFPRYSPDGKWIVFTQSDTGLAIQPSSRLCIVPAAGGKARVLTCNTPIMNSWHSWSPNSKWLVFSSKVNTPYTQLFLTHIDAQGNSTVPVLLSRFSSPNRACLVPEFVNIRPENFPAFDIHDLMLSP